MKSVNVAALKEHLSRYLQEVQQGMKITVKNRRIPVAELIPISKGICSLLVLPPAKGRFEQLKVPKMTKRKTNILKLLEEERGTY